MNELNAKLSEVNQKALSMPGEYEDNLAVLYNAGNMSKEELGTLKQSHAKESKESKAKDK